MPHRGLDAAGAGWHQTHHGDAVPRSRQTFRVNALPPHDDAFGVGIGIAIEVGVDPEGDPDPEEDKNPLRETET